MTLESQREKAAIALMSVHPRNSTFSTKKLLKCIHQRCSWEWWPKDALETTRHSKLTDSYNLYSILYQQKWGCVENRWENMSMLSAIGNPMGACPVVIVPVSKCFTILVLQVHWAVVFPPLSSDIFRVMNAERNQWKALELSPSTLIINKNSWQNLVSSIKRVRDRWCLHGPI